MGFYWCSLVLGVAGVAGQQDWIEAQFGDGAVPFAVQIGVEKELLVGRHVKLLFDSLAVVLKFALNDLGLHRVEAACLPANTASKSLLMRSGFREEGYAREFLRIDGRWQDHLLFGILRTDLNDLG